MEALEPSLNAFHQVIPAYNSSIVGWAEAVTPPLVPMAKAKSTFQRGKLLQHLRTSLNIFECLSKEAEWIQKEKRHTIN